MFGQALGDIQMYIGYARVLTQVQSLSLQLDALYVQWDPPRLYEIETDEGFSLETYRKGSVG
jgi:hypothetical protein